MRWLLLWSQWEGVRHVDDFTRLARCIRGHGVAAGVCVAPATPTAEIEPLLSATWKPGEDGSALGELDAESRLVDMVDVLAVEPGRGGQKFNHAVLEKVRCRRRAYPAALTL